MPVEKLIVKEHYQNIHMEQPIAPGVYSWNKVPRSAVEAMLEHGKAEWANKPPKEFLYPEDEEDEGEPESAVPDVPDFFDMNIGELRDYALTHGIGIPAKKMKQAEIVALIEAFYAKPAEEDNGEDEDEGDEGAESEA